MNKFIPDFTKYSEEELRSFIINFKLNPEHVEMAKKEILSKTEKKRIRHEREMELQERKKKLPHELKVRRALTLNRKIKRGLVLMRAWILLLCLSSMLSILSVTEFKADVLWTVLLVSLQLLFIAMNSVGLYYSFGNPKKSIGWLIVAQYMLLIKFEIYDFLYNIISGTGVLFTFNSSWEIGFRIELWNLSYKSSVFNSDGVVFTIVINFLPIIIIYSLRKLEELLIKKDSVV